MFCISVVCYFLVLYALFHCINITQFVYPLFCWRTFRLFPVWGYYEQRCYKHSSTSLSKKTSPCFSWIYIQEWNCKVLGRHNVYLASSVEEKKQYREWEPIILYLSFVSSKDFIVIWHLKDISTKSSSSEAQKIYSKSWKL